MKKTVLVAILLICVVFGLSSDPSKNLYTVVVPEEYTSFVLNGVFGSLGMTNDLLQIDVNFSPTRFGFGLGLQGSYEWYRQQTETEMSIPADITVQIRDNDFLFDIGASPYFTSHTLDIAGFPGFWGVGGNFDFDVYSLFSGLNWVDLSILPYGEVGIGRTHSIYTLKKIETIMRHLDVEPTEDLILEVAKIMYRERELKTQYAEDYVENHISYYASIAQVLGRSSQVDKLILIDNSQHYTFTMRRYLGMRSGWKAGVRFTPGLVYAVTPTSPSSIDFNGAVKLFGEYGSFLIEDMVHLGAVGEIVLALETNSTPTFFSMISSSGTVTYLPETYRWWADGTVGFVVNTANTPAISLNLSAKIHYLIHSSFMVHGGVSLNTATRLRLFAGGQIRLW